jgi:hypothetical protein
MPSLRRSARLAAKGTGAPLPIPEMYVTQLKFASRWRDKDYGDASISDWFTTMTLTTNKTIPPVAIYSMPKNSPMHSFWYNRIRITDTHIMFGCNWSPVMITTIDGLVQVSDCDTFFTRTFKNTPFHPSVTFAQICDALKKHLVHVQDSEYRFKYEFPNEDRECDPSPIAIVF